MEKNYKLVPCVSICLLSKKCPHGGETECPFSHKRPCNYSTECRLLHDAEHCAIFYHPLGQCKNGSKCKNPQDNHWVSYAHPCFIQECKRPTVGIFNGWLCGYHARRISSRHPSESKERPDGANGANGAAAAAAATSPVEIEDGEIQ